MIFETICIIDGVAQHLEYHQRRLDLSRAAHWKMLAPIDLQLVVEVPDEFSRGRVRCRVDVTHNEFSVQFSNYSIRQYDTIGVVSAEIPYSHKWTDRSLFRSLFNQYPGFDDFLIAKNGYLTDMTIANIALFKDGQWFTPAEPLLCGTTRARLLLTGEIVPRQIHISELSSFKLARVLNAMTAGLLVTFSPEIIINI